MSVDGEPVAAFSNTDASGWQSWKSITAGRVKLAAGNHVVRISMPTGSINLNWLDVVPR